MDFRDHSNFFSGYIHLQSRIRKPLFLLPTLSNGLKLSTSFLSSTEHLLSSSLGITYGRVDMNNNTNLSLRTCTHMGRGPLSTCCTFLCVPLSVVFPPFVIFHCKQSSVCKRMENDTLRILL